MHQRTIKGFISNSSGATTKIKHLISQELYDQALAFYAQHIHPFQLETDTAFIVPSIAKACAHSQSQRILGRQLHCNVIKNGFDSDFTVSNSLLSLYAKSSDVECAEKVFDEMPSRDAISWNSMINCYTQNGLLFEALYMLKKMYGHGLTPKTELVACCVSTCVRSGNWRIGRAMHALLFLDERMEYSTFVATALVGFYWSFGDSEMAFRVFDRMVEKNEVSWTTMVSGWIEFRDYVRAFDCVRAMQFGDVKPNRVTLVSVLPACVELRSIIHGKEIHGYAVRHGYDSDYRLSSALLHMYCECGGGLNIARRIFDVSVNKEVVMWSSMIAGYSQSKNSGKEAILLFNQMQMEGIRPNDATVLAVITACVSLLSQSDGGGVHGYALKSGLGDGLFVQNALINMYSKCGSLRDSVQVFDEMKSRDCISWSSLITAYGLSGNAGEAMHLFYDMQENGIKADGLTYLAVLSTCNHSGLIHEGRTLFDQALKDADVSLTLEHYGCYIDLLGRAGEIQGAYDVMCRMPMKPTPQILTSLVSACRLYGRLDIAELVANMLVTIEPENAANHTLLSMVYAESDKWSGVEEVRKYMKGRKLRKNRSFSRV